MHDQPERDESARDVGQEHGRILHHLENGRLVVVVETRLIKGEAAVAQRIVHRNEHFAIFVPLEIDQAHAAREVFRNVRPGITIVREVEQSESKLLVETPLPHDQLVGVPVDREGLRIGNRVRDEPRA